MSQCPTETVDILSQQQGICDEYLGQFKKTDLTYYGHYLFNQVLLIVIDPADKFTPFKKIADSDINLIFSYDMGDRMFLLNYGSC